MMLPAMAAPLPITDLGVILFMGILICIIAIRRLTKGMMMK